MNWPSFPTVVLALTVCSYWMCVAIMVLRVSANTGRIGRVLVPERRSERLLWLVWVPIVVLWMALPVIAAAGWAPRVSAPIAPDPWTRSLAWTVVRSLACAVAFLCLAGSIICWRHMGARWRMAVDSRQRDHLIADGPFALSRHPIYSLGLLLAACSVVVLPSLPMLTLALVYATLIILKVREEEQFLAETYGPAYVDYRAVTGRFVPRPAALVRNLRAVRQRAVTPVSPASAGKSNPAAQDVAPQHLSPFQRAMLLWEHLHPYNAAHAVQLAQPARPPALQTAVERVCGAAGIGALAVDEASGTYWYLPAESVPVRYVECRGPAHEPLRDLVADELNQPFSGEPQHPIRWIILDDPQNQAHFVIAVYRHVAADAHAIELLLSAVLREYAGQPSSGSTLTWRGFDFHDLMTPLRRTGLALLASFRTAALYFRFRFMHKMPDERAGGDETQVLLRRVAPGLMERLSRACRQADVGPNDVFAAALASAIAALTPDRHTSRHRRALALAATLDARSVAGHADLTSWFGNCVGDMLLMIGRPDDDLPRVVAQVRKQSRWKKRRRAAALAVSSARLFFVRCIWPLFHVPHNRRSYRKLFPICGGVSTVSVFLQRLDGLSERMIGYWRICPPGPAMPIVLAPTILGSVLSLGLTYRTSCLSARTANELLNGVCARLDEFAAQVAPAEISKQPTDSDRRVPANVG
jgi:protein-S-isoprenylcysteine O-methyltransferase Ste14